MGPGASNSTEISFDFERVFSTLSASVENPAFGFAVDRCSHASQPLRQAQRLWNFSDHAGCGVLFKGLELRHPKGWPRALGDGTGCDG